MELSSVLSRGTNSNEGKKELKPLAGSTCTTDSLFTEWVQIEQTEANRTAENLQSASVEDDDSKVDDALPSSTERCSELSDAKLLKMVYRDAVKVILHRLGRISHDPPITTEDLLTYIHEAFAVSEEYHAAMLKTERNEEAPKRVLRVRVCEGRGLASKDENGLSDPFAVLGIVHLSPEDFEEAKRKGKMKNVQTLTSQLKETAVQSETLNPVWDEEFDLAVSSVRNRYLQVDLWDYDADASFGDQIKNMKNVAGIKGAKRWVKNVTDHARSKSGDDFLGRMYCCLDEIPQEGCDSWHTLEDKHRNQMKSGKLHLRVQFKAQQNVIPLNPDWNPTFVYYHLFKEFLSTERSSIASAAQQRAWNYQFSNALPATILCQYQMQHSMSELLVETIEFSVLVGLLAKQRVDYQRIAQSLKAVNDQWKRESDVNDLAQDGVEKFAENVLVLKSHCMKLVSRLRDVFPVSRKHMMTQLRWVLECLVTIYDNRTFREQFPNDRLVDDMRHTIEESTFVFYEQTWELCAPQEVSGVGFADQLVRLIQAVTDDVMFANEYYNQFFLRTGLCYFTTVFKTLDRKMCVNIEATMALLKEDIQTWSSMGEKGIELCSTTFKMFMTVRRLLKYYQHLELECRQNMQLSSYVSWFQAIVIVWLEVAEYKALQMVDKAVKLDKAVKVADSLQYSTSAVDIGNTILQMVQFWQQLDWPNAEHRFGYITILMTCISNVITKYGEYISDKLKRVGYYDDEGQFDVTAELCVVLNSLDFVAQCMENVPSQLKWEELAEDFERIEAGGKKKALMLRDGMMTNVRDDMENRRLLIIRQIGLKMAKDMTNYMLQYVEATCGGKDRDEALSGLMTYLTNNLTTMFRELFKSSFEAIVRELWYRLLKLIMSTFLQDSDMVRDFKKAHGIPYFKHIKFLFDALVQFFESDTLTGGNSKQLHTDEYKDVFSQVNSHSQDSTLLIREYYQSRYATLMALGSEQRTLGSVSVSLAYCAEESDLTVTVLHAKNLPALDHSVFKPDTSDPYIVLTLEPAELFPTAVEQKTTTKMQTVTPLYDETFHFTVSKEEQELPGCCVQLHCYDWDRFSPDDFIGEAVVPIELSEVSCSKTVSGKTHVLPFCQPEKSQGGAFNVLCTREDYCTTAASFLKRRRKVFQSAACADKSSADKSKNKKKKI